MAKIRTVLTAIREIEMPLNNGDYPDKEPRHREMIEVVMDPYKFLCDKYTEVTVTTEEIYEDPSKNKLNKTNLVKR